MDADHLHEAFIADGIIREFTPEELAKIENAALRKMLWLRHDSTHFRILYGDDGEMQCSKCMIDFKRDSIETIHERFDEMARRNIEANRDEINKVLSEFSEQWLNPPDFKDPKRKRAEFG